MKKVLFLLSVSLIFASGCGNSISVEDINQHVDKMRTHATSPDKNLEEYEDDLIAFNEFLNSIDKEKFTEYVEVQIEANKMRLKGIKGNDAELISDSSFKQLQALQILENLN